MSAPKQFFFMFSSGEYSDYTVGELCVCDHEVTVAEWNAHYETFIAESSIRARELNQLPISDPRRDEPYQKWKKWREENDPEATFKAKHGMTVVPCVELWRD